MNTASNITSFVTFKIREEHNFAEDFRGKKRNDSYIFIYTNNGQISHFNAITLTSPELESIVKKSIGYFPNLKSKHLDLIVNSNDFKNLIIKMSST